MRNADWLVTLIEDWFYTDFRIYFALRRDVTFEEKIANALHGIVDKKMLLCRLGLDGHYDYMKRDVPWTHGGGRFFKLSSIRDIDLGEEVRKYCQIMYDKTRIIDLIEVLDKDYIIFDYDTFYDNWPDG